MARIETLVSDINALMAANWQPSEGAIKHFSDALAKRIGNKFSEEYVPRLRLSNLGRPDRQLWYEINHPEKRLSLPPETRRKFLYGDILEEFCLFLAKEAGHTVEREQEEVSLHGVLGHIDAIVDGELLDVKSSSTPGMEKFRSHLLEFDDPFYYLSQLRAYMAALGVRSGSFLAIDKTLGTLVLDTYEYKEFDYESEITRKQNVLKSSEIPPRCHPDEAMGESGNKKLGLACSYCGFRESCWPGLRTFLYSRGPEFLTRVVKLPYNKNGPIREVTGG